MHSYHRWLGHEELDKQHYDLADAVARCTYAEDQYALTVAINDFFEIWREHTQFEGVLMRQSRFPYTDQHEFDHFRITREISTLFRNCVSKGFGEKDVVTTNMEYWFDEHLKTYDAVLVEHLMMENAIVLRRCRTRNGPNHPLLRNRDFPSAA